MKKPSRGFSLIELLVVIAIIGVLTVVVLASLSVARSRSANAGIKASLTNMRSQGILYWQDNGNYATNGFPLCTGVFSDPVFIAAILSVNNAGGNISCRHSTTAWMMFTPLKTPEQCSAGTCTYWCVDDSGASKGLTSAQASTITNNTWICP